jgi:RNA polymerase subunit RPABC4/transcription elongation factor Spt4
MDASTLNNLILFTLTALGAGLTALWLGMTMWTWQDMRARSRDPLAQIAASLVVFLLPGFGIIVYLLLRPRETLADAYERSLEEEALLQEIEEKPRCPGCGRPVKAHWQACPYCHTRLKKPCVNCGEVLELSWNICPVCTAAQVGYDAEQIPTRSQRPSGRPHSVIRQMQEDASPYDPYPPEFMEE